LGDHRVASINNKIVMMIPVIVCHGLASVAREARPLHGPHVHHHSLTKSGFRVQDIPMLTLSKASERLGPNDDIVRDDTRDPGEQWCVLSDG